MPRDRAKKAKPTLTITIAGAPKCADGAMLARPLSIFVRSGSMKFYGAHTGTSKEVRIQIKADEEVVLRFGACPNPAFDRDVHLRQER